MDQQQINSIKKNIVLLPSPKHSDVKMFAYYERIPPLIELYVHQQHCSYNKTRAAISSVCIKNKQDMHKRIQVEVLYQKAKELESLHQELMLAKSENEKLRKSVEHRLRTLKAQRAVARNQK